MNDGDRAPVSASHGQTARAKNLSPIQTCRPQLRLWCKRRTLPTRVIQAGQKLVQDNVIGTVLSGAPIVDAPAILKLLDRFPLLRRIPGRIIGLGVRRERVSSPVA